MRAKNRVHENNIVDRFDTRYSEHLSHFRTRLDCSKAIMIFQFPHIFPLYTLYTKHPYITPIRSHLSHQLHVPYIFLIRSFNFSSIVFFWNILLTINAFHVMVVNEDGIEHNK